MHLGLRKSRTGRPGLDVSDVPNPGRPREDANIQLNTYTAIRATTAAANAAVRMVVMHSLRLALKSRFRDYTIHRAGEFWNKNFLQLKSQFKVKQDLCSEIEAFISKSVKAILRSPLCTGMKGCFRFH